MIKRKAQGQTIIDSIDDENIVNDAVALMKSIAMKDEELSKLIAVEDAGFPVEEIDKKAGVIYRS
jgi:hypothetical protein